MDFLIVGIFLICFLICGGIVISVSVFGAKEKTFEEALQEKKRKLELEKLAKKKSNNSSAGNASGNSASGVNKSGKWKRKNAAEKCEKSEKSANVHHSNEKMEGNSDDSNEDIVEPEIIHHPSTLTEIIPEEEGTISSSANSEPSSSNVSKNNNNNNLNKKDKKKKIIIEELVEEESSIVIEESISLSDSKAAEIIPEDLQTKKNKTKKQQNSTAKSNNNNVNNVSSPKEILSVVKKTPMNDEECQHLIDILLNKQIGSPSSSGEWIDGNNGSANNNKSLQKQLNEKDSEIQELQERVKSISDRMILLRQELNTSKTTISNSARLLDETKAKSSREIVGLKNRLQQQIDSHNREKNNLQGQLQMHIQRINQLQTSPPPPAQDPVVYDNIRLDFENRLGEIQNKLKREMGEKEEIMNQLRISQDKLSEMDKVNSSKKALEDKCKFLESSIKKNDPAILEEKIEELNRLKNESDKKIKELSKSLANSSSKLREKEDEASRLIEENERLSEQLTSAVERPKADGQESGSQTKTNGDLNGHSEVSEAVDGWRNKYLTLVSENEKMFKEKDCRITDLKSQIEKSERKIDDLKKDLDVQLSKNNDVAKANKIKADLENSQKVFLQRLFPDIKVDERDHDKWLSRFESLVVDKLSDNSNSLEKQVAHYQSVLSETESMLKTLQSSVESEEVTWKQKLNEKESEIIALKSERDLLAKKNSAMDESLNVVKQAEEMQLKLQELQEKLSSEEAEKEELVRKFGNFDDELKEKERLVSEVTTLRNTLDEERKSNGHLAERLAKMSHLISTGQEALNQEQKTVELLSDPVNKQKDQTDNGLNNSENELTTPINNKTGTNSQLGSVASLDLSESNNGTPASTSSSSTTSSAAAQKKKSKKKKLLGLFKN